MLSSVCLKLLNCNERSKKEEILECYNALEYNFNNKNNNNSKNNKQQQQEQEIIMKIKEIIKKLFDLKDLKNENENNNRNKKGKVKENNSPNSIQTIITTTSLSSLSSSTTTITTTTTTTVQEREIQDLTLSDSEEEKEKEKEKQEEEEDINYDNNINDDFQKKLKYHGYNVHYLIGEYVWCQVGGWGFWPGKIVQYTNDSIIIEFSKGEQTAILFSDVSNCIKSFLHYFHVYTTVSTCRLNGFEEALEEALSVVGNENYVSNKVIQEIKNRGSNERWSAYVKRISLAIQNYLNELQSLPIFRDFDKILGNYKKYLYKKEEEEKKVRIKQQNAAQVTIIANGNDINKSVIIPLRKKGKKIKVKEMIHELEKTVHFQSKSKVNDNNNQQISENDNYIDLSSNSTPIKSNKNKKFQKNNILNSSQSKVLDMLKAIQLTIQLSSWRSIIYSPTIYISLYQYLYTQESIPYECIEYVIVNSLPNLALQLLLTRYDPYQPLYRNPKNQRTLFHLIAQTDNPKLLDILIQFYSKHISNSSQLNEIIEESKQNEQHEQIEQDDDDENDENDTTNENNENNNYKYLANEVIINTMVLLKDKEDKTLIHVACQYGSSEILSYLYRLFHSNKLNHMNLDNQFNLPDKNGHTPFYLCTFHDRSKECAEFFLSSKMSWIQLLSIEERIEFFSSSLHSCIQHGAIEVGKLIISSISKFEGNIIPEISWMIHSDLIEWCSDMSLGRERYRIIFDVRDMETCKREYLEQVVSSSTTTTTTNSSLSLLENNALKNEERNLEESNEIKEIDQNRLNPRRSSRTIKTLYNDYTEQQLKKRSRDFVSNERDTTQEKKKSRKQINSNYNNDNNVNDNGNEDEDIENHQDEKEDIEEIEIDKTNQKRLFQKNRVSNRVGALSLKTKETQPLPIEEKNWKISNFMLNYLNTNDKNKLNIIPHYIYSTEPYWNFEDQSSNQSTNETEIITKSKQPELDETGTISTGSDAYLCCCKCQGDCANNPTCPCIMRNGQRSPYSKDGHFDFSKARIYECGPECSCNKKSCSLRRTQHGVSLPLIVCMTGSKGFGVMATKVILKGAFVCAYVGERITEADLEKHEEKKINLLKSLINSENSLIEETIKYPSNNNNTNNDSNNDNDSNSNNSNSNSKSINYNETSELKGYVTYTFQIHDGSDVVNIDSEYIGNVARFFNHSCDPNLRPVKVICYRGGKSYLTMAFFAIKRIESGEELTWKYVSGISRRSGQRCYCNTSNCVGYL